METLLCTGGCDLQGHPLVILPSQRYPNLVQLSQAEVIRLLKYLAFLSRFDNNFIMIIKVYNFVLSSTCIQGLEGFRMIRELAGI